MVTGRTKGLTFRGKGNVVLVAAQLDDADGNPTEQYVLLRADEFGRLRTIDAGAVATFLGLTDTPGSYVGQALLVLRVNAAEDAIEFVTAPSHSPGWPQIDDVGGNTWGMPGWAFRSHTSIPAVAERLTYGVIYVERSRTFNQIGIHVTVGGGAGTVARLGIYNGSFDGSGDLTPGTLVLDAGTVAVNAGGQKSIAISQLLEEGFYFLAMSTDGNPELAAVDAAQAVSLPATGRNTTINTGMRVGLQATVADGAAALPDPAAAPDTLNDYNRIVVNIGDT